VIGAAGTRIFEPDGVVFCDLACPPRRISMSRPPGRSAPAEIARLPHAAACHTDENSRSAVAGHTLTIRVQDHRGTVRIRDEPFASRHRQRRDPAPFSEAGTSSLDIGPRPPHPPDKCTKAEKAATPRLSAALYLMERSGAPETQAHSTLPSSAPEGAASSYFRPRAPFRTKTSPGATKSPRQRQCHRSRKVKRSNC
jgi:hypothetical protein